MSLEKDVEEPGSDERCSQMKVATQRRVSFKPGDPIELPQVPSRPCLDQTPTNDGPDDETTDGPDKYRGRSRSEVAPTVIERFLITRERKWSVTLASLVAAIPALLLGLTLGYPSNALLDLTGDATELPPEFFFSTASLSLFTVSLSSSQVGYCNTPQEVIISYHLTLCLFHKQLWLYITCRHLPHWVPYLVDQLVAGSQITGGESVA